MRIIAGKYGGMRIAPPARMPHTRPTTDMAREGLFNMLASALTLEGLRTLELFAGTGLVSLELASRGAEDLTLVEKDPRLSAFLAGEAKRIGIPRFRVVRADVFSFLGRGNNLPYGLIFADPPYGLDTLAALPDQLLTAEWMAQGGHLILEHDGRHHFEDHPCFWRQRSYGSTIFSIFIL